MDRTDTHKPNASVHHGPGGLMADAVSFTLICLVLLGLAGVLYKALAPDGWVSALLDHLWNKDPALVWIVGFGSASLLAAAKWWIGRSPVAGQRSEVVAYAFMALGLFFFFKLMVTGSL